MLIQMLVNDPVAGAFILGKKKKNYNCYNNPTYNYIAVAVVGETTHLQWHLLGRNTRREATYTNTANCSVPTRIVDVV